MLFLKENIISSEVDFTPNFLIKCFLCVITVASLIPKMAANRLQRWAITLSAFDYELQYVHGKQNIIADPLSRMPLQTSIPSNSERMGQKYNLLNLRMDDLPMTKSELRNMTLKDAV